MKTTSFDTKIGNCSDGPNLLLHITNGFHWFLTQGIISQSVKTLTISKSDPNAVKLLSGCWLHLE